MQAKYDEYSRSNFFGATWLQKTTTTIILLMVKRAHSTASEEHQAGGLPQALTSNFARNALVALSGSMPTCCVSPINGIVIEQSNAG
jgi:hypothetical protein